MQGKERVYTEFSEIAEDKERKESEECDEVGRGVGQGYFA
jgi:hypothetical protein